MSGWPGLDKRIVKCSEGNFGALRVLTDVYTIGPQMLDTVLTFFETFDMRGSWIWVAYKDVCNEDIKVLCSSIQLTPTRLVEGIKATPEWQYAQRKEA